VKKTKLHIRVKKKGSTSRLHHHFLKKADITRGEQLVQGSKKHNGKPKPAKEAWGEGEHRFLSKEKGDSTLPGEK